MRYSIFIMVLLFGAYTIAAQQLSTNYKLYSSKANKEVSLQQMVSSVNEGQVLIFGEQHDDSIGHLLEAKIFEQLHERFGEKVILAMEMFHRDVQYIVDEYLADQISEKNFIKESRAWDTYKTDYKPAVEFAKKNKLQVLAANAPSRYTNIVTRKGLSALNELNKNVRKNFIAPLPIDTMTGKYFDRFLEAMGGHSTPGMNLYQSQNFWDATMSWSIAKAMKANKNAVAFMMVGRFHSDYHSGLTERLMKDYKKQVTTISCFAADDFETPNWEQYKDIADFVILTKPKKKE